MAFACSSAAHNPALLDALPDDAVPNVVFCYRGPETGTSRLVRLADIPHYPELIAQGAVGHLVTRGILDRFVKLHPGSEERRRTCPFMAEGARGTGGIAGDVRQSSS